MKTANCRASADVFHSETRLCGSGLVKKKQKNIVADFPIPTEERKHQGLICFLSAVSPTGLCVLCFSWSSPTLAHFLFLFSFSTCFCSHLAIVSSLQLYFSSLGRLWSVNLIVRMSSLANNSQCSIYCGCLGAGHFNIWGRSYVTVLGKSCWNHWKLQVHLYFFSQHIKSHRLDDTSGVTWGITLLVCQGINTNLLSFHSMMLMITCC